MKQRIFTTEELKAESENNGIVDFISKRENDKIQPMTSSQLDNKEIPKKKVLLSPWFREKEISMIYAPPGTGKTFFALNCAYSLVSGKKFLKFNSMNPVDSLLYVDAEMDEGELQERWRMIVKNKHHDGIQFYTPSLFPSNMVPVISTKEGQDFYNKKIIEHNVKIIIFDNISMLTDMDENSSQEWNIVQRWLVQLKNSGVSIILIHHTNKGKKEHRGTSKIADTLNSIIFLEAIKEEGSLHSARFKVSYTKKRGFYGEDAEDFEAWLDESGDWIFDDPNISNFQRVIKCYQMEMNHKDISIELNIPLRTVYKYIDDGCSSGVITKRTRSLQK